ncbi:hypothetical protein EDB84DRAFT_1495541 [Lactarius hengduanensis]|nr:hypothetical protein EDB84DRAFT_1495541 [Lactarius hengduanensis]
MDPSSSPTQANSREYQQQAIDAEIKSLEGSIRALKLRRNALTPISSLPTEVIAAIFSFLLPIAPSPFTILGERPDQLTWLRVAIPLYLEARVPIELQARVSHTCHLAISAERFRLRKTLEGLVSPAPTLEYLSLFSDGHWNSAISKVFIPDTLFDGTTPRLSHLQLHQCDISWKSPLLKGLKYLQIHIPSRDVRPSLSDWLDALDEMPQLEMLNLHSASPIAPPDALLSVASSAPSHFLLEHLNISASVRDCGLALVHLLLPALTRLHLAATSCSLDGSDVQEILPYVVRHAHGPQDTQPLQSVLVRHDRTRADVLAWTKPNIDAKSHNPIAFLEVMAFAPAMTALPMDGLVTLTSQVFTSPSPLNTQSWLRQAPRWPLLQRVRLATPAARGFTEMLLEDTGDHKCPLLPSLTNLVLIDVRLSARRTLRLCDALMKRVEQGVPLETLDLRTCLATSRAIELLSPDKSLEKWHEWVPYGLCGSFLGRRRLDEDFAKTIQLPDSDRGVNGTIGIQRVTVSRIDDLRIW